MKRIPIPPLAALCLAVLLCGPAAALEVALTVSETAGTARKGGTVTSGVPFARGAVKDVKKLSVSAGGKVLPAQFTGLARWDDGSVRWALMDTQVSLPAGGKAKLVVRGDGKNPAPASPVKVSDGKEKITISTGPLELAVDKKKFNLFSSVKIDGKQLVTSAGRGLVLYKADGGPVPAGAPAEVKVEAAGPMRATVMLRGKFPGVHGGMLGYTARVYAFAGRKFVKLRVWLENRGAHGYTNHKNKPPSRPEWYAFDGVALELGLALGGEVGAECEGVKAGGKFRVLQTCAPGFTWKDLGYSITGGGKELKKGARTDGAVTLSGDGGKLVAAVRHFWQNYEKAIELDGSKLKLWLWPREGQYPRAFSGHGYPGYARKMMQPLRKKGLYNLAGSVHKGHEMILDFSGRRAAESSAELSRPLFALASARHYASTEAAPGLFAPPEVRTPEEDCNEKLDAWVRMTGSVADPAQASGLRRARRGPGLWYGWMDFGDLAVPGKGAVSLHYDWPWVALVGAMRTGDVRFMRLAEEMTRHRVEVDQQWSDSAAAYPAYRGFQRAGYSFAHFHCARFTRNGPGADTTWLPGVVLYYMLTGDAKARECLERSSKALARFWARAAKSRDWYVRVKLGNMQVCARSIFSCCAMHGLTAEEKWLELALKIFNERVVAKWKYHGSHLHDRQQIRSQGYTRDDIRYCYSIQALCLLHHRTGSKKVLELLEVGCEKPFPANFFDAPLFLADLHAYVALKTGRKDYADDALEHWIEAFPDGKCPPVYLPANSQWSQRAAMQLRSGHLLQYCFWKKGKTPVWKPARVPKAPPPAEFPKDGVGPLVLEAESFGLTRSRVRKLAGASGGRAVLFDYLDGHAARTVKLKKGTYEIVAYIMAPHREADAFFMKAAGIYQRLYADEKQKISTAGKMTVKIARDGPCELRIEPAETDFFIDRVEIRKVK